MSNREPEKDYMKALHDLVDKIYRLAADEGWGWNDLADEAGVAHATVYRLGMRQTQWPEFRTVYRLATAVGCELELMQRKEFKNYRKVA